MHWHAYQWVEMGVHRSNEVVRQPLPPHVVTSVLSPRQDNKWPGEQGPRAGATFGEVWLAVVWLAGAYGRMRAELPLPEVLLEERLEAALDLLPRGVDVRWREWLSGGRFVTIGVACCPNWQVPRPCPMRRSSSSERAAAVPALTAGATWEVGP
ncbi:hypothetical protein [Nonomuraea glycinis]|uniref:hypothetical protein n=1 Tax=Nonomuraea glycinis TaxID=2047744 RepID=UPI002E0EBEFE|nr:hypothetical protein OHA68_24430 [Nonomuraea glycinis]